MTRTLLLILFLLFPLQLSAEDNIKIAAVFARTGVAASYNMSHFQGIRFALHEINNRGGVLGRKVELVEFDNKSTKIGSKLAAKRAVEEGVVAVIGASWSSHSLGMAPVLQRAGIPMITPDSTNPKVTEAGDYIFRVCFIDPVQAKVMAKFAIGELKAEKAVILTDVRSDYSMGLSKVFRENFIKLGGTVVSELHYKQKQTDFSSQLSRIKQLNTDVIYIAGHDESGYIVTQARSLGINSVLLGGDGWGSAGFMLKGGNKLSGSFYTTHWSELTESGISSNFVKKFSKFYGHVESFAALSYDATMLLVNAISEAGATDRAKIRETLASTNNYQGVTGSITFDKKGDPIKGVVIIKLEKGKPYYLKTMTP